MPKKRQLFLSSSFYGMNYVNASVEQYFSNPSLYLEAQKRFQDNFPTDIVSCPIYMVGEGLQYGTTQKVMKDTAPIVKVPAYEGNMNMPQCRPSINTPYYDYIFECIRRMKVEFADKDILAFLTSPVDYGILLFGMFDWIEMMLFDKERFNDWLYKFIEYHNEYKQALVDNGMTVCVVSNVLLNNIIVPEKIIRNRLIPFMNKHICNDIPTIIHSSFMPVQESIRYLEELNTSIGYIFGESDDIDSIREQIGREKLLAGHIGSEYIYKKLPEAIERMVYEVLVKMENHDSFILSTAGADLNLQTTSEQIKAFYKGMKRYEKRVE